MALVEIAYGLAGSVFLAISGGVLNLFFRVSVLETQHAALHEWLTRIESKLDRVILSRNLPDTPIDTEFPVHRS